MSIKKGNDLMREKKYQEAILVFEELMKDSTSSLQTIIANNIRIASSKIIREVETSKIAPLNADQKTLDEMEMIRPYFDNDSYQQNNPDVKGDLLLHYCTIGWKNGIDPSLDFSTNLYLELNQDVKEAGINPFWHYAVKGKDEGRPTQRNPEAELLNVINDIRGDFDEKFYFSKYPDVKEAKIDPIRHYCEAGWIEGRDPSPLFSTEHYLNAYEDIKNSKLNPFWHYIISGRAEGRECKHPGGFKADIINDLKSAEQIALHWKKTGKIELGIGKEEILKKILDAAKGNFKEILLSIGHDNYTKVSGGIQLCINREEKKASSYGLLYLNIHPWQPLPFLADMLSEEDPVIVIMVTGVEVGACKTSVFREVVVALTTIAKLGVNVAIHSLLGHSASELNKVFKACRGRMFYWVHDYFLMCQSFTLQRNAISYCGAPKIESNACQLCIHGDKRSIHLKKINAILANNKITFLSPSAVAKEIILQKNELIGAKFEVVPHIKLDWKKNTKPLILVDDKIRIAYVGAQSYHKGWNVFLELVNKMANDSKYEFFYFGVNEPPNSKMKHVNVHVRAEKPFEMVEAIKDNMIDVVLHWATWAETFSFTAFEALASGAFVFTNQVSGNVGAATQKYNAGEIFESEEQLHEYFLSEKRVAELKKTIHKRKQELVADMIMSDMTLELFVKS